jgi:hypothetical protein
LFEDGEEAAFRLLIEEGELSRDLFEALVVGGDEGGVKRAFVRW